MSKSGVNEELVNAISNRQVNKVKSILKKNVFFKETLKNTPYQNLYLTHYAVLSQSSEILEYFLNVEKMNPNLPVEKQQRALQLTSPPIEIVNGDTCLHVAARLLNLELIMVLMKHPKIEVSKKNRREETAAQICFPHDDVQRRLRIQNEILKKEVADIEKMKNRVVILKKELSLLKKSEPRIDNTSSSSSSKKRKKKQGKNKSSKQQQEEKEKESKGKGKKTQRKRKTQKEIDEYYKYDPIQPDIDMEGRRFIEGLIMLMNPESTMEKLREKSIRQSNHRELVRFRRVFESSSKIMGSLAFKKLKDLFVKLNESGNEFDQGSVDNAKRTLSKLIEEDKLRKVNVHKIKEIADEFITKFSIATKEFLKLKNLDNQIYIQNQMEMLDGDEFQDDPMLLSDEDDEDDEDDDNEGLFGEEEENMKKKKKEEEEEEKKFKIRLEEEKKKKSDPRIKKLMDDRTKLGQKCFQMKRELEKLKGKLVSLEYCYERRRRDALKKMDLRLKRLNELTLKDKMVIEGKKCQEVLTKFEREARVLIVFRSEHDYLDLVMKREEKRQEIRCSGLRGSWSGNKRTILFYLDDEMERIEQQVEQVEAFITSQLQPQDQKEAEEEEEEGEDNDDEDSEESEKNGESMKKGKGKSNIECLFKFQYIRDEYLGVELKEGDYVIGL